MRYRVGFISGVFLEFKIFCGFFFFGCYLFLGVLSLRFLWVVGEVGLEFIRSIEIGESLV